MSGGRENKAVTAQVEREKLVSLMRPTTHSDLDERTAEQVLKLIAERDRYRADRDSARDVALMNARLADRYRAALERMMRGDHHVGEHSEPEACDCTTNAAREILEGKE